MATKKVQRQLLLDPTWLILAEPDVGSDSSSTVTTVWPIWQVQSLIDRSDPRTLQIGMNAHKPGMRPGEAIAYNPPVCTYFTLTLNFDDVKKCNEAAVHLQTRRRVVRGQMLQKARMSGEPFVCVPTVCGVCRQQAFLTNARQGSHLNLQLHSCRCKQMPPDVPLFLVRARGVVGVETR
ncbi:unnamed protein product [Symbiodinium necroappetens]|uniref:Uncharacterized protein n=1 Tax=Symbiodinium necroappetens TaxID=1628268 RepID=A0A812IT28_9DINO|nr:unnamed protein product [Symbiodinium necroappetens]